MKPKRPTDMNQLAVSIVALASGESQKIPTKAKSEKPIDPTKNPNAVALGKLGGQKGGKARAASLTPEQRSDIAKKAAAKRWGDKELPFWVVFQGDIARDPKRIREIHCWFKGCEDHFFLWSNSATDDSIITYFNNKLKHLLI